MDWESWIQDVGGSVVKSAAEAKYSQPYEIQKMQLQQLGQLGMYKEGQPVGTIGTGLTTGMKTALLIGGALLIAVVMMKA